MNVQQAHGLGQIDRKELANILKEYPSAPSIDKGKSWVLGIAPLEAKDDLSSYSIIGEHLLLRVFVEFLSFEWFIQEQTNMLKKKFLSQAYSAAT
jgi:hypothetical protein